MTQPTPYPVAILTDFGTQDTYVGTMKGVMLRRCPGLPLVDLTHEIAPQNIRQAAFALWTAYRYFSPQTVFLVVVDPGVGSSRMPVAAETSHGWYVAPDNGVLSDVLAEVDVRRAVAIDPAIVGPHTLSATFHGRDVFAPAAARLACGEDITTLGEPVDHLITLEPPRLLLTGNTVEGEVIYIDHFGNVVTSIGQCFWRDDGMLILQQRLLPDATPRVINPTHTTLYIGGQTYTGIARTYTEVEPGHPTPLINSAGQLEIAINQGSAQQALSLSVGQRITIRVDPSPQP